MVCVLPYDVVVHIVERIPCRSMNSVFRSCTTLRSAVKEHCAFVRQRRIRTDLHSEFATFSFRLSPSTLNWHIHVSFKQEGYADKKYAVAADRVLAFRRKLLPGVYVQIVNGQDSELRVRILSHRMFLYPIVAIVMTTTCISKETSELMKWFSMREL